MCAPGEAAMRKWIVLWLSSLAVVSALTSGLMRAQTTPDDLRRRVQEQLPGSRIISGDDIGFRLEGMSPADEPVGTLVVRIDGQWVVARAKMSIQRP
jgi:hypothetical protein